MTLAAHADHVRILVADGVGHVTLDRPEALNALNHRMLLRLTEILTAWRDDTEVSIVLLDGAGERGFCAGGDIREMYAGIIADRRDDVRAFFWHEYRLDAMIAEYPKPVVAVLDGIAMGGGIGIGGHASIRVVTERSRLAMPETRIGLTPDVGGALLLGRAPGRLGEYLALTGESMTDAAAIDAGFADYLVPRTSLPALAQALRERADPGTPSEIVMLFDETPEPSPLQAKRHWIDDAFAADDVPGVLTRLRELADGTRPARTRAGAPEFPKVPLDGAARAEAAETADALAERSPTALAVTLHAVRSARALNALRPVLEQDFRLVSWFLEQPDLAEGIRAQVVDKDRSPKWSPASLDGLEPDVVDAAMRHPLPAPLWDE
ncbi:enoyl-CoA hydratase/isomerase family protein [Agromyces rhizosphaerae]|uniref:enoyl-CoA hydratase/isomerase family protein n=1 Tax=Agromyces rhizosphaerae TaxID=88374 RepID=UPI0024902C6A|nr:enoyl-CoA hydratase/isomerase family protein [Agromyces rhizosphaerae]